ncbi:MAG: histone-like nucleoid-structuring protein Lsr2 [Acidimicrobiales bacterium]
MTQLVDDLDGSNAQVTVALTVDSKRYRVDLSKANYDEYIAPLVKAARPSKIGRPAKKSSTGAKTVKRAARKVTKSTAYSKLSAKDQTALRSYLKRTRGRVSDSEVTGWRSAGKP